MLELHQVTLCLMMAFLHRRVSVCMRSATKEFQHENKVIYMHGGSQVYSAFPHSNDRKVSFSRIME